MSKESDERQENNLELLRRYLETMPMSIVWLQTVIATHEDMLDEEGDKALNYVVDKLKDKPRLVAELVSGIFYTLKEHSDDIRAQTEGVIMSISEVKNDSNN